MSTGDYTFTDRLPADFAAARLRADVLAGLAVPPGTLKTLPPTWLYDKVGSELFEEITRLPEYYPTRAERQILRAHAVDAVHVAAADTLVELGSGSSLKTRLLLDALTADGAGRHGYVALDVSEDALREACRRIALACPGLAVHALRADFTDLAALAEVADAGPGPGRRADAAPANVRRLVAFLGGTIGNFAPAERAAFLAGLRSGLRPGDHLLLGADLVKSPDVLVPAYDDAAGVTAAFDLNLLAVLDDALDGDLDPADFTHRAVWDAEQEWIEMHLVARRPVRARFAALDLEVTFEAGEHLRTEISAKFRREGLTAELRTAGFAPVVWWTDDEDRFSLSLWRA